MSLFQHSFHDLDDIFEIIKRDENDSKNLQLPTNAFSWSSLQSASSSSTMSSPDSGFDRIDSATPEYKFADIIHYNTFYGDSEDTGPILNVPIPKTSDAEAPKVCSICGEATNCCHYDVPSCSGCKTFFRRSVISTKEYSCKKNGKCEIKKGERCRACRFSRCILVGMNPAAIKLPDTLDMDTVIQHVENHRKRTIPNYNDIEDSQEPETSLMVTNKITPIFNQTRQSQEIDFLLFLELKVQKLRESDYNPQPLYFERMSQILQRKTEFRNCDRYSAPSTWPIKPQHLELMYNTPPPPGPPKRMWLAIDIIICIEMAKTLPFFDKLDFLDQAALLKHVTLMNAILTQCYYSYLKHSDAVIMPDGLMPIKFAKNSGNLAYEVFCRPIEPLKRIKIAKEEYVLLKTLVFSYPAAKDISEKGRRILEREFERYSKILLHHIQSQLGDAPGAVKYSQVIAILEALTHFAEKKKEHHVIMKMMHQCIKDGNHPDISILEEVIN